MHDALVGVTRNVSTLNVIVARVRVVFSDELSLLRLELGEDLWRHLDLLLHVKSNERNLLQEVQRRDGLAVVEELGVREHLVGPARYHFSRSSVSARAARSSMICLHVHVNTRCRLNALADLLYDLRQRLDIVQEVVRGFALPYHNARKEIEEQRQKDRHGNTPGEGFIADLLTKTRLFIAHLILSQCKGYRGRQSDGDPDHVEELATAHNVRGAVDGLVARLDSDAVLE